MTIYFISGLGADKRMFSRLKLPGEYTVVHLEWIAPIEKESLENYVKRLSAKIDTTKPFHLLGLSFGGMVATELAKIIRPEKIFLLSSASMGKEIPWYYKFFGLIRLQLMVPAGMLKKTNFLTWWFAGVKTEEDKDLLRKVLKETDSTFLRWSITKIAWWTNAARPSNLFHIHGSFDNVLPIRFIRADHVVKGGGHLMVLDRWEEISKVLVERLST